MEKDYNVNLKKERMSELATLLNHHTKLYDDGVPEISDAEWDALYFELVDLEELTGILVPNSPTQKITYSVVNELRKVTHSHPMLSLEKTKELSDVLSFAQDKTLIAMLKMDGLTCSLTYEDGKLVAAETRGNGLVGEDILHNALVLPSIPRYIPVKTRIVVDGEIICKYNNFESFKNSYKNPRNFAAGSIRLLDSSECEKRMLTFVAWDVVEGFDCPTLFDKLSRLTQIRFTAVPFVSFSPENKNANLDSVLESLNEAATENFYPIDGIVFKFADCQYGNSLGRTNHHFKNGLAYKFYDEDYETELVNIEWSMGRTGLISPVAIFKPLNMDGSTVSRASLSNVSVMTRTLGKPFVGQKVSVSKRNQIIPKIESAKNEQESLENLDNINYLSIPTVCPVCGEPLATRDNDGVITLWCVNSKCEGKLANQIDHFCSKKGLDIKGLSMATIEKLIDWGWLIDIKGLYSLNQFRNEWVDKAGFGAASVDKILNAIEESKKCELSSFISAIGIPLIGATASKDICKYYSSWADFRDAVGGDWSVFDNFGPEMSNAINRFNFSQADYLSSLMEFVVVNNSKEESNISGITFCITGKVNSFKNRDELKAYIESAGGKVVGSMSSKVQYLINNDNKSTSAKNKAAISAGIPIITEAEFIDAFGQK